MWARGTVARAVRRVNLATWILPLARVFAWTRVEGLEQLLDLDPEQLDRAAADGATTDHPGDDPGTAPS